MRLVEVGVSGALGLVALGIGLAWGSSVPSSSRSPSDETPVLTRAEDRTKPPREPDDLPGSACPIALSAGIAEARVWLTEQQERLEGLQAEYRSAFGSFTSFPEGLADKYRPERARDTAEEIAAGLVRRVPRPGGYSDIGVRFNRETGESYGRLPPPDASTILLDGESPFEVLEVDCSEYPCLAVIDLDTRDGFPLDLPPDGSGVAEGMQQVVRRNYMQKDESGLWFLARMVVGLYPPDERPVWDDGRAPAELTDRGRRVLKWAEDVHGMGSTTGGAR
jgi:hypothetical protein